jgi:hypothetical protein
MRSPVVVIGPLAFKFARNRRGRDSNLYEAELYRNANATRLACYSLFRSSGALPNLLGPYFCSRRQQPSHS